MKVNQPKSWLYKVVRNDSFSWLEEQKRNRELEEELETYSDQQEDPILDKIIAAELTGELFYHINRLPTECKKILILVRIEGLSIKETAEKLGLSIQTVKNQLTKALNLLRENPPARD